MWKKKKYWIVTIFLADKDEDGELINWSEAHEEYFAETLQEAEKLKEKFLNGEDKCYGNLVEDCIISDEMEEREVWKSGR